jgi:hypothetical protein
LAVNVEASTCVKSEPVAVAIKLVEKVANACSAVSATAAASLKATS